MRHFAVVFVGVVAEMGIAAGLAADSKGGIVDQAWGRLGAAELGTGSGLVAGRNFEPECFVPELAVAAAELGYLVADRATASELTDAIEGCSCTAVVAVVAAVEAVGAAVGAAVVFAELGCWASDLVVASEQVAAIKDCSYIAVVAPVEPAVVVPVVLAAAGSTVVLAAAEPAAAGLAVEVELVLAAVELGHRASDQAAAC